MALPAIIMLDTNIASYIIRDKNEKLNAQIAKVPINRLCISVISEAELRYGIAFNSAAIRMKTDVEAFLNRIESLPWDSDAAASYGVLRATLRRAGTTMDSMDMLIAAHALSVGAMLVTNDQSFRHIKGLKTVDWTQG
jgi:tRNA(fMet)-specific endonuclease VapC